MCDPSRLSLLLRCDEVKGRLWLRPMDGFNRATRFAPSTTGLPHLGTLLSGLLCYLHARREGARFVVRMENLDRQRCKPEFQSAMLELLEDFGLCADQIDVQSEHLDDYQRYLHRLANEGYVYYCRCSRGRLKAKAKRGPDGSFIYDNRCRKNHWKPGESFTDGNLRCRFPETQLSFSDRLAGERTYKTLEHFGDPIVLRRDGAFSYHFSSIVDDERIGVTDIVRGRDLIDSTPSQLVLRNMFQMPVPDFFHHFLLMEDSKEKFAKLHGSISVRHLRQKLSVDAVYGYLALFMGLREDWRPMSLSELERDFSWERISRKDVLVRYNEESAKLFSQKL